MTKQAATEYVKAAVLKTGQDLQLSNKHEYPKITKIVVHMGIGKDRANQSLVETLKDHLAKITGQKPVARIAKKSIATFKVRAGEPVGLMVTLRGKKMADFLSKFIHLTLPAIRDFRGIPQTSFDKQGSYNVGIKEHTVFPEISFGSDNTAHGIQITITTNTTNVEHAKTLLKNLGFPFSKAQGE